MPRKRKEPEGENEEEIERAEKRRLQNREAAQRCRDKKKQRGDDVKRRVHSLQTENTDLNYQLHKLREEKAALQAKIDSHAKECEKFKLLLLKQSKTSSTHPNNMYKNLVSVNAPSPASSNNSDQIVPENLSVKPEPQTDLLKAACTVSGLTSTTLAQALLSTVQLKHTGISLPDILPGQNLQPIIASTANTDAAPSSVPTALQLGTETMELFKSLGGSSSGIGLDSASTVSPVSNVISTAQSALESNGVNFISKPNYAFPHQGQNIPENLTRCASQNDNVHVPQSPSPAYSDISTRGSSVTSVPESQSEHSPTSPSEEGSQTDDIPQDNKSGNIPLMVLQHNMADSGYQIPSRSSGLVDTMEFGLQIFDGITKNKK